MEITNLREAILKEHSMAQCKKIVEWVGSSMSRFDELFYLFTTDEYRVVQRAAWPVSHCVLAHHYFLKKHWDSFIKSLNKPELHTAVKRNSIRLMQNITIPKKHQGAVMDICFKYLEDPTEEVSVKAFSLTVLGNLSKQYPEIVPEIKLHIQTQMEHQSTAFKSRATIVLNKIDKLKGLSS